MKKILLILALFSAFTMAAVAQNSEPTAPEKTEGKWSEMSYVNVPIVKVYEGKEAYIVLYLKNKVGVGKVVIPKAWAKATKDTPKKLKFRNAKTENSSYMCIQKKNGDFHRVILTVPASKSSSIWAVADYHKEIEGSDKDTLEELEL